MIAKVDVTLMIAEPGFMCGSDSRISRNGARNIRLRKRSSWASSLSSTGVGRPTPALLIRYLISPQRFTARSTIRGHVDREGRDLVLVRELLLELDELGVVAPDAKHRIAHVPEPERESQTDPAARARNDRYVHKLKSSRPN